MKTLKFHGYSDDSFGEYGLTETDHDNCASGAAITFQVSAEDKSVYVTGQYSRCGSGCWSVSVEPADEDNLPDWPMRIYFEGYSTVIEIDVPDDTTVQYVERKG